MTSTVSDETFCASASVFSVSGHRFVGAAGGLGSLVGGRLHAGRGLARQVGGGLCLLDGGVICDVAFCTALDVSLEASAARSARSAASCAATVAFWIPAEAASYDAVASRVVAAAASACSAA